MNSRKSIYLILRRRILTCCVGLIFLSPNVLSQTVRSEDGWRFSPNGTYKILNIWVNIVYDQNPSLAPDMQADAAWFSPSTTGFNVAWPSYLDDFCDVSTSVSGFPHGIQTRLYHESSFGNLVLLADHIAVNIPESFIPKTGQGFTKEILLSKVIQYINMNGGIGGKLKHNSPFHEFDTSGNGKFDFVQVQFRNTIDTNGQPTAGNGFTPAGSSYGGLLIGNVVKGIDYISSQNIGDKNISTDYKSIVFHEFSHNLLGGNNFHAGGGNHYGADDFCTFMGTQGGWGLMGGYGSSLVSCNAYERWRLNWRSGYNTNHRISASGLDSDIEQSDGAKTFYLRDFVHYGDAIRIKLPYKDAATSSNQYIWLENHQIGRNGKLDFNQYTHENACIPAGTPGIYAYYQVGKDILQGSRSEVFAENVGSNTEMDNLKPISAEGNWNMKFDGQKGACIWGDYDNINYLNENSLSGNNDLQPVFHVDGTQCIPGQHKKLVWIKTKNRRNTDNALVRLGDNLDAFEVGDKMSIGSNPSTSNTTTFYVNQLDGTISGYQPQKDTRKIYPTGLSITVRKRIATLPEGEVLQVDIAWNDYMITKPVDWAGDIVIKEKVILGDKVALSLSPNPMVVQDKKHPISNSFSPPTKLSIDQGAQIAMMTNSSIIVKNGTTLELKPGSSVFTYPKVNVIVEKGATLIVGDGVEFGIRENSNITIRSGGKLCMGSGSKINLKTNSSILNIQGNLLSDTGCNFIKKNHVTGIGKVLEGKKAVFGRK